MGVLRRLMHLAAQKLHQPAARKRSPVPPHLAPSIAGTIDSRLSQPPPRNPSNVAPSQEHQEQEEEEDFSFEIDWSVFTMAHIQTTIQDMLLTLVGLPIPNQQQSHAFTIHNGHWRTNLDVHHLYDLRQGSETRFLVRGVIYDMAALAISPVEREKRLKEIAASGSKDWSNLVHESVNEAFGKVEAVSAEQVVDTLGLKSVDGLKERIGGATTTVAALRKKKLQEKQSLEEILGRGDSIRAKYADRLRHKQALAEARKEQEKLGVVITTSPGENDSAVLPGCPALIRYLEERGVFQALLARGPDCELRSLMNQLGGFRFREIRRMQEESLNEGMLSDICTKWELPSKEILLVVGASGQSDEQLKIVADKGYFICRVQSQNEPKTPTKDSQRQQTGIASWFNQLAEGTLHIQDKPKFENDVVHFRVADMTELKWVIEDLNGVSYRTSTMIRGFK